MSDVGSGSASNPRNGSHPFRDPVAFTAGVSDGVGGLVGGARFRVERDAVPQLIAAFEAAHDKLVEIDRQARQLGRDHTPPADEPYSRHAASEISRRASDDHGCHGQANKAYRDMVQGVIDNLKRTFDGYGTTEDHSASNFRQ